VASSSAQPCLHGQPWTRPGAFHCTRIGRRGRRVVPRSIRLSAAAPDSAASGLRRRTCDSGRPRELSSILVRGSAPRKPFPAWLLAFSMPARLSLNLLSLYCFNQPLASIVAVLATGTTVTWWYRGGGEDRNSLPGHAEDCAEAGTRTLLASGLLFARRRESWQEWQSLTSPDAMTLACAACRLRFAVRGAQHNRQREFRKNGQRELRARTEHCRKAEIGADQSL